MSVITLPDPEGFRGLRNITVGGDARYGHRCRNRQLVLEVKYWAVSESGLTTVEAWQMRGIARKGGYRWRARFSGLFRLFRIQGVVGV